MITSPQNEKLKLVRKLRERKHREREGLFVDRGRGPARGRPAPPGAEPRCCSPPPAAGSAARRSSRSCSPRSRRSARGPGRSRVWPQRWADGLEPPCVYLHGVARPRQRRRDPPHRARAARRHASSLGPGLRRPVRRRRRCGRAWARSSPSRWRGPASRRRRRRGRRSSPTVAPASRRSRARDALPRRRARGAAGRGARRAASAG